MPSKLFVLTGFMKLDDELDLDVDYWDTGSGTLSVMRESAGLL